MRVVKMGNMAAIYTDIKKDVYDKAVSYDDERGYCIRDDGVRITALLDTNLGWTHPVDAYRTGIVVFNALDGDGADAKLKIELSGEGMDEQEFNEELLKYLYRKGSVIQKFEEVYRTLETEFNTREAELNSLITRL